MPSQRKPRAARGTPSPGQRIAEAVRAVNAECHLFTPGKLVVAVSGGVDSLALLHVLQELRAEFGLSLHVATLDHGIRGDASAEDVQYVQLVAQRLGLPVTVERADVPAYARTHKVGLEAAARIVRYDFLSRVAVAIGATAIAVGHNRDDQAETILMHILRGSGLGGLRGMPARCRLPDLGLPLTIRADAEATLWLLRPLLNVSRSDINTYVQRDLGLKPRRDRSNADPAYYRNRIRKSLMPLVRDLDPGYGALLRLSANAQDAYDALFGSLPPVDQPIPLAVFRSLLPIQRRHCLGQAVSALDPTFEVTRDSLIRLDDQVSRQILPRAIRLTPHVWARIDGTSVTVFAILPYPERIPALSRGVNLSIKIDEPLALGSGWRLLSSDQPGSVPTSDELRAVLALPHDARVELRTLRPGDRFCPAGMGGRSRKMSDMLIDLKVPAEWRNQIPLLVVNGEIVWFVAPTRAGFRSRISHRGDLPAVSNMLLFQDPNWTELTWHEFRFVRDGEGDQRNNPIETIENPSP